MSLRKKLLDTFGAQVSSDHERYPADVKCLGFLYLYVGRYPRNNASRNTNVQKKVSILGLLILLMIVTTLEASPVKPYFNMGNVQLKSGEYETEVSPFSARH